MRGSLIPYHRDLYLLSWFFDVIYIFAQTMTDDVCSEVLIMIDAPSRPNSRRWILYKE